MSTAPFLFYLPVALLFIVDHFYKNLNGGESNLDMALNKEIEVFYEKLAKIKGKTPADEGRRAAIEDDIARLELRRKKETGALENRSHLEAQWND